MKKIIHQAIPHAVAVALFLVATAVYFSPLFFDGKQLGQYDILQSNGSSKEVADYRERTGEEALWTNSVFSGMPAYQISVTYANNWLQYLHGLLALGLPSPASMMFLSLLCFYIMLLCFRVNPWLAIAGAFAYALSTYFLIIAGAGHNTKMRAMAFMPLIIGGLYMAYGRGKVWPGMLLTCLALGLQVRVNHLQITYYTAIVILIYMVYEAVHVVNKNRYADFLKTSAAMAIAVALAVGANITNMLLTAEYTPYSTRGASELTDADNDHTSGLDRSYILDQYSYGVGETMNLFIPSFSGGPISMEMARNSDLCNALVKQGYPRNMAAQQARYMTYWGGQEGGTSGPVYLGAAVIYLFVLGLIVVRGRVKWWLLTATILSIALAWGKHLWPLSNLFIDFFPMYSKFRTVSMTLTIAMFTVPLLGILGVNELLGNNITAAVKKTAVRNAFFIAGGIALVFSLIPDLFLNFSSAGEENFPEWVITPLHSTREWALRSDAFRSLIFVTAAAAVIWFALREKLRTAPTIALLTAIIVIDLWAIDKRYLDHTAFKPKGVNVAQPTPADIAILQDTTLNYRVMNTSVSTFNDATTSFFHKSIGGYHGAKMKRYQELIEHHIAKSNMAVLNMLNTRYVITADRENGQVAAQINPGAIGNAWLVSEIKWVENADAEIAALNGFDPLRTAIVDRRYEPAIAGFNPAPDSTASIRLTEYEPNRLTYTFRSQTQQLAVFSEIYYDRGWQAYIDGQPVPHIRANYVLRAMTIPAGTHSIVFRFEPASYVRGEKIALASSICIILLILGAAVNAYRKQHDSLNPSTKPSTRSINNA